jgi:hypothetical protein
MSIAETDPMATHPGLAALCERDPLTSHPGLAASHERDPLASHPGLAALSASGPQPLPIEPPPRGTVPSAMASRGEPAIHIHIDLTRRAAYWKRFVDAVLSQLHEPSSYDIMSRMVLVDTSRLRPVTVQNVVPQEPADAPLPALLECSASRLTVLLETGGTAWGWTCTGIVFFYSEEVAGDDADAERHAADRVRARLRERALKVETSDARVEGGLTTMRVTVDILPGAPSDA